MPCSLCGTALPEPERARAGGGSLSRCGNCGLVHQLPRPASTAVDASQLGDLAAFAAQMRPLRRAFAIEHERLLDTLERFVTRRGALLEVGSAMGWFLDAAMARGWHARGVEPVPVAPGVRSAAADAVTQRATLETATLGGGLDAIVMTQVIEHFIDPLPMLAIVAANLAEDGVVFIETPNYGGVSRRLQARSWMATNIGPGHWHLFDPGTLAAACRRCGLEVVHVDTYMKGLRLGRRRALLPIVNAVLRPWQLGNNVAVVARKRR